MDWPFRYTTCWVELGSSESESDWIFFFLIALSSEGVEERDDPTPERKLVLFSSSDELGLHPLHRLARSSAAALSSGIFSSSEMTSSSSGWLDWLLRGLNELVDWEVFTSLGTEVLVVLNEGLSSMLLRKNKWVFVEGARGLLLLLMVWYWRGRIFRGKGDEIRQWNVKQIHPENDVYRDAKYAKQKQKQMSACLQLIKIKMKANRHWVPVVGWLSDECRLVAP